MIPYDATSHIEDTKTASSSYSSNSKYQIININYSSISELEKLPGIGESMAQRIISYREENGFFNSIEEIKNVSRHWRC